ncbi:MAG: GAF domain-containing sensor histidine kinase [Chloroflexi bacterium]|nr:GAF domain-containing sensor histidine kinase [Chloroflexota bacterium]
MDNQLQLLQRQVRILNRLAEISLVLNSTWELDALLGYLMDAAAEITDSEAASVLLWEPQTRELRFAATTTGQTTPSLTGQSVPLEGSIAGMALQNNEIVQVDDAAHDPRHYEGVDEQNRFITRSLLAVPMRVKDHVIGVLEVVNKHQLPWTSDDREYTAVLAAQAAVAIETAQLMAALQAANRELSELDKLKNDFIAIASHELRTPLAVMLGYASFLQDEAEGKMSEHVAKVVASGLQLRAIIEDLTNLRYLHQSAAELQCKPIALVEVMEEAVQDVLKTVEAKGHKLTVQFPDGDVVVNVDSIRAVMALTNILNNAIRFTPDGGQITLRGEARAGEAWVTIADNGIGLADDQLERIFEKFYQVEDHMTRKHGGLGIGLSIARALVEAHGGRVWATSPGIGQGATFTVALPLANSH